MPEVCRPRDRRGARTRLRPDERASRSWCACVVPGCANALRIVEGIRRRHTWVRATRIPRRPGSVVPRAIARDSPAPRPSARPIALPSSATTPKAQRCDDRAARTARVLRRRVRVLRDASARGVCGLPRCIPPLWATRCRDREPARPGRARLSTRRVEPASRSRRPRRMTRSARRSDQRRPRTAVQSASRCPKPSQAAADSLLCSHDSLDASNRDRARGCRTWGIGGPLSQESPLSRGRRGDRGCQ